jgi:hypothetical protein
MDFTARLFQKKIKETFNLNARFVGDALPVYGVMGDTSSPDFLKSADLIAYRYIINNLDEGKMGQLEISADKKEFRALSYSGGREERFFLALDKAKNAGLTGAGAEIRILDMPHVKTQVLWIAQGEKNSFINIGMFGDVELLPDFIAQVNEATQRQREAYEQARHLLPPGQGDTLGG